MPDDPDWQDIFSTDADATTNDPVRTASRREARQRRGELGSRTAVSPKSSTADESRTISAKKVRGRKPRGGKRSLRWLGIVIPVVLFLGAVGGVVAYGWFNYNTQVRDLIGMPLTTDYDGTGNGDEVVVTVRSGDIGSDVAKTLHDAGVTMTYSAVYDYLVANPDISFLPGNWRVQEHMSAASAVAALGDDANKVTDKLLLREGISESTALEVIAETTGLALEDVEAAAADPQSFGLPSEAPNLEGYLFPATYELDGSETAQEVLQMLVATMNKRLDAAGVKPEDRYRTLIMASIIQREAGADQDDFYKISRVFQNRLDQDINLQSDATVAYGTGRFDSVWTEKAERADASNPYNTYANPGLPVGPIGLPGDRAIDAALKPAEGPWLFFVPINLATGETVFSKTADQHQAAVDELLVWCKASAENATYCE